MVYINYIINLLSTVSLSQQVSYLWSVITQLSLCITHLSSLIPRWTLLYSTLYHSPIVSHPMNSLSFHCASLPINCLWIAHIQFDCIQVHLQFCSIAASQWNSLFTASQPWNVSSNSHNHGIHVHLPTHFILASKRISNVTQLLSPNSHDHGLQVHFQTCFIIASNWISKLAWSQTPSLNNHELKVPLQTHSIMVSKFISKFTQSQPPSQSLTSLNPFLQVLLQLNLATVCSTIDCMYIYRLV